MQIIQSKEQLEKGYHQSYGTHYHYYIYNVIEEATDYIDLIKALDEASPYDVIHIHLNTPGGYLHTAICIINAIRRSQGTVIGYADSEVASAGSMIFVACHSWVISPLSSLMIHDATQGVYGKQSSITLQAKHDAEHLSIVYNDIYKHFLTELEISEVVRGIDYWFLPDQVEERLEILNKVRESELEDEELDE
jgi:ATP-dependent protease ClpP protease subunit